MNYLKILIALIFVAFTIFNKNTYCQEEKRSNFYTGYQHSFVDYVQIGLDSRYVFIEGRASVNKQSDFDHDAELAAGINFYRRENHKLFFNISALADFYDLDIGTGAAIGGAFYPFSNRQFGITMEAGAVMPDLGALEVKVRGGIGFSYYFGQNNLSGYEKEKFNYNPKSGVYFSALGTTLTGGINYARYFGNSEIHAVLSIGIPTGGTAGYYYHFIDREKSPHWHMYAGADISVGDLDGVIVLPYIPVGIQYLSANGFTFSVDAGPLYTPDDTVWPWAGIKIGKTFFH